MSFLVVVHSSGEQPIYIYIYDLVNELDCSSTQTLPLQATGFQTGRPWTHTKLQAFRPAGPEHTKLQAFRPAGPEHTPSYRLSDRQALNTHQATGFQTSRPWTHTKLQAFRPAGPGHTPLDCSSTDTASPNHTLSDQQALDTNLWTVLPQTLPVQTTHFQTSRPWTHTSGLFFHRHCQSKPHTFRPAGLGHTPLDCSSTDTTSPNHTLNLLALLLLCLVCTKQKTPKFMPVKATTYTSNAMQFGQGGPENCK